MKQLYQSPKIIVCDLEQNDIIMQSTETFDSKKNIFDFGAEDFNPFGS